jgi:hypothetical protein
MKNLLIILLTLTLSIIAVAQRKSVTNQDLEEFRQKRIKAEQEYRENYKKLGMPSPEELEKQEAERQQRLTQSFQQAQEKQRQNENYWQSQARILRSEYANLEAQIKVLRQQISRVPNQQPLIYSYGYYPPQNYYQNYPQNQNNQIFMPPNNELMVQNARIQNTNTYGNLKTIQRRRGQFIINYNLGNYGYVYPIHNQNFQLDELTARLRILEQQRAGLLAQWDLLEDEARRNGVKIY